MLKQYCSNYLWVDPSEDLVLELNNKWAKTFDSPTTISNSITKELVSKKKRDLTQSRNSLIRSVIS